MLLFARPELSVKNDKAQKNSGDFPVDFQVILVLYWAIYTLFM